MEGKQEIITPPVVTGWLRKQGRKGLIKNWKKRYFVLKNGKISYYENESKQFPNGEGLKGELNLMNTELELHDEGGKQQILIVAFNGENSLLIETETETETNRWAIALKQHIRYANKLSIQLKQPSPPVATANEPPVVTGIEPDSDDDVVPDKMDNFQTPPQSHRPNSARQPNTDEKQKPITPRESPRVKLHSQSDSTHQSPQIVLNRIMDAVQIFISDHEYRAKVVSSLPNKGHRIITATKDHFFTGNLGERGELLLVGIFVLSNLVFFGAAVWMTWFLTLMMQFFLAPVLFLIGWMMVGHSFWLLDVQWSPWLVPCQPCDAEIKEKKEKPSHTLVMSGAFAVVRHPMYAGLLLLALGNSLWSNSVLKLTLTFLLMILLMYAVEEEERALLALHPRDYVVYMNNTPKRLIPFFY